ETARRYGFRGGLVPGVTVYAYLTHPLTSFFGRAWLERGTATVRFVKPIFEGDSVIVSGSVTGRDGAGGSMSLSARVERGEEACVGKETGRAEREEECAVMSVTIPAGLPTPVNVARYREAVLPAERPPASREHLLTIAELGTPVTPYDEAQADAYLAKVSESLPLYRGAGGAVHPAFYLDQANRALSGNVRLGPWIHAASTVRHLGAARVGDTLRTLGRVRSLYEKKGHEFV